MVVRPHRPAGWTRTRGNPQARVVRRGAKRACPLDGGIAISVAYPSNPRWVIGTYRVTYRIRAYRSDLLRLDRGDIAYLASRRIVREEVVIHHRSKVHIRIPTGGGCRILVPPRITKAIHTASNLRRAVGISAASLPDHRGATGDMVAYLNAALVGAPRGYVHAVADGVARVDDGARAWRELGL